MAFEVTLPKFGLTMHEGTVKRFFKRQGETVSEGEPLYEVETEKVLNEVPAPASGVLAAILVAENETVECGALIALIALEGESATPQPARPQPALEDSGAPAPAAASSAGAAVLGRRSITPVARKLAAELGVDLNSVRGTGPGGRIAREDVERAGSAPDGAAAPAEQVSVQSPAPAPTPTPSTGAAPSPAEATVPFSGMRRIIAERMVKSLRDAAQLTITTEADVTPAVELKERLGRELPCSYTDLMVQAVARALRRHPRLNSRLTGGTITLGAEINIGVAVALEEGLIVPVIRHADRKALAEIAAESKALADKARAGRLGFDEVTGGSFTISNLGTHGIDAFTPIINTGEAAILGLGRIIEKPVIYRGEIARRSVMTLSLTFDHRLIDGAPAASFLQAVVAAFNYGDR